MPGVRYSKKREAIASELMATRIHPSAEWLYERLKPRIPDLSLATVYRNLALLKSEGVIISVGVVDGQERYDANISEHPHFVCEGCGRVLDMDGLDVENRLSAEAEELFGIEVKRQDIVFRGVCADCKNK